MEAGWSHLDDAALHTAAEQAAGRIAKAMGFTIERSRDPGVITR